MLRFSRQGQRRILAFFARVAPTFKFCFTSGNFGGVQESPNLLSLAAFCCVLRRSAAFCCVLLRFIPILLEARSATASTRSLPLP